MTVLTSAALPPPLPLGLVATGGQGRKIVVVYGGMITTDVVASLPVPMPKVTVTDEGGMVDTVAEDRVSVVVVTIVDAPELALIVVVITDSTGDIAEEE